MSEIQVTTEVFINIFSLPIYKKNLTIMHINYRCQFKRNPSLVITDGSN